MSAPGISPQPTTQESRAVRAVVRLGLVAFVLTSVFGVTYPYTLEPYEGTVLLPALASGETIYGPEALLKPPFLWAAYGPTFYLMTGVVMKAVGASFWPGRLLSLLATLGTAAFIFSSVQRVCGSRMAAFVGSGIFIRLPTTWAFGALSRVDALGLFFATAALSLALAARGRWAFLAGCAASLAFLTKPTLIAATVALGLSLLLRKEVRAFLVFAAGGISTACIVASCLHWSGNDGYWTAQLLNSRVPFAASSAIGIFRGFAQNYVVLTATALFLLGRRPNGRVGTLVGSFLCVSGVLAALTSAKVGASLNYYCEFGVAIAFSAAFGFAAIESHHDRAAMRLPAGLVAISLLGQLLVYYPSYVQGRILLPSRKRAHYGEVIRRIQEQVPLDGTVGGEYPELALLAGRQVTLNDWAMFVLGPGPVQRILEESISRRTVDAWVMSGEASLPGYALSGGGFEDAGSISGIYFRGPLLYVRAEPRP